MKRLFFCRRDVALYAVLALLLAASCLLFLPRFSKTESDWIVVEVDGSVVAEFPLDRDIEYLIRSENGGTNRLVIKDGQARVTEASCPDHVCVKSGIVTDTKPAVCRPNGVVIWRKEAAQ